MPPAYLKGNIVSTQYTSTIILAQRRYKSKCFQNTFYWRAGKEIRMEERLLLKSMVLRNYC